MLVNRTAIIQYANDFWWQPCRDGKVWLSGSPIDIAAERKTRGLTETDWAAVFLNYDSSHYIDGLYFLRRTQLGNLASAGYFAPNFPASDVVLVQDWAGLNDCAHFASECLKAGGAGSVYNVGVAKVVGNLRDRDDTKTLAYFVDVAAAERIVNSGIMQPGDVIAFGAANKTFTHAHSTIFMGNGKVANHTHLNHPNFTGGAGVFGQGVWKPYASLSTGHPRVILIHFTAGDAALDGSSSTIGWWSAIWNSTTWYYYFEKTGRVSWTLKKPGSVKQAIATAEGKGYWFESPTDVKICWTNTGTYEVYGRTPGASSMSGTCNGTPISATKMT